MELPVKRPDENDDVRDETREQQTTSYTSLGGSNSFTRNTASDGYGNFDHNKSTPYGSSQTIMSSSPANGRSTGPKTYQLNRPAELDASRQSYTKQQSQDTDNQRASLPFKSSLVNDRMLLEQMSLRQPSSQNKYLKPVNAIVLPRPSTGSVPTAPFPTIINSSQRMPILNNTKFSFPTSHHRPLIYGSQSLTTSSPNIDERVIEQPMLCCNDTSSAFSGTSMNESRPSLASQTPYLPSDQGHDIGHVGSYHGAVTTNCQPSVPIPLPQTDRTQYSEPGTSDLHAIDTRNIGLESTECAVKRKPGVKSSTPFLHGLLQQSFSNKHKIAANRQQSMKEENRATSDETIDNLTDTINRVAAGEGELRLRKSSTDIRTNVTNAATGNQETKPIEKKRSHSTIKESDKGQIKKHRSKPSQKTDSTIDSMSAELKIDSARRKSLQEDLAYRYPTDPILRFNAYGHVFRPDNDAIKEIETKKLSAVSGHHLLSLTDAEKEFLRCRGYISPVKDTTAQSDISANLGNSCKEVQQPNVKAESHPQQTMVDNKPREMAVLSKGLGGKSATKETNKFVKTPVVLLNNICGSQSCAIVRSTSQTTNTVSSFSDKSITQQTKVFYVLSKKQLAGPSNEKHESINQNALTTQSVESIKREIGSPLSTRAFGKARPTLVKSSSCQSPKKMEKYICLGNNRYRIVDSPKGGGATLIKSGDDFKTNRKKSTMGNASTSNTHFPTVSESVKQPKKNQKLTVAELLKIKRESDTRSASPRACNPVQMFSRAMNPNKVPCSGLIIKLEDISQDLNAANCRQINIDPSIHPTKAVNACGASRETSSTTSLPAIAHSSKVRLEVPIKIINPNNVTLNKSHATIGMSSANKKENNTKTEIISNLNESLNNIGCCKKMDNSQTFQSTNGTNQRKTLPAPKPKSKLSTELKKKKKTRSTGKLNDKSLKGGFGETINSILRKSKHPMIELARSLDLIPIEECVKKALYFQDGKKVRPSPIKRGTSRSKTNKASPKSSVKVPTNGPTEPTQTIFSANMLQMYTTADGNCEHNLHSVQITCRKDKDELLRWYPLGDHPCILHFSEDGLIEQVEVEGIKRGMYIVLDCPDCMPTNQRRRRCVKASLSMYPPYLAVVPPNTLAFALGEMSEKNYRAPSVLGKGKDVTGDTLESILVTLMGNEEDALDPVSFFDKYSSVTDRYQSPKYHSPNFYSETHKNCFEKDIVTESDSCESESNLNNNTCVSNPTPLSCKAISTTRFSERAMALKRKQMELLECCRKMKNKQSKMSKKRKRCDDMPRKSFVASVEDKHRSVDLNVNNNDDATFDVCGLGCADNERARSSNENSMVEIIRCTEYGSGSNDEILNVDS